ncbi:hypothetical protein FA743_19930 [Paracoccus gahaiensis]|uniref:Uncharacterized protein n=1 Tax=Paracoccus gahaiensis TaxID=1706839 RepID=A0A4U0R1J9_9RHOB|nr:hypothetical protein [Paracoccus gahaiensis]TJZ88623.1 hypothetical protein FA743_19930 [Paracoccus gahaiensis]
MARERTFSLVARSLGGTIAFEGELNDWMIQSGVECRLRDSPDFRMLAARDVSLCDARIYEATTFAERIVAWRDGTEIAWRRAASGALQITVQNDATATIPSGTLIVVPDADWRGHGALAFQGIVGIGRTVSSGSDDYLLEGTWQALQSGMAVSIFRDVTDVVQSGTLTRGSAVDFRRDGAPQDDTAVTSFGHLTPTEDDQRGVIVTLLTQHAPVALRVNHFGLNAPTLFKPDWVDAISSSTMLFAIAVMLSLLIGILELGTAVARQWHGRINPDDDPS